MKDIYDMSEDDLQSMIDEQHALIREARRNRSEANMQASGFNHEVKKRYELLDKLKKAYRWVSGNKIRVSDHAIVRYIERNSGVDMEHWREQIMPRHLMDFYRGKEGTFIVNGNRIVIENNTVVTVLPLN